MPENRRCGAKKRDGTPCQAWAVQGSRRCRMHGGTNPGPPAGNKNALTHGEHETILPPGAGGAWSLDEDEAASFSAISAEVAAQLDEQIRLTVVRMRRMMRRIQTLRQAELQARAEGYPGLSLVEVSEDLVEVVGGDVPEDAGPGTGPKPIAEKTNPPSVRRRKHRGILGQIQAIEDALTRVQLRHIQLLQLKHQLELDDPPEEDEDVSGYIEALEARAEAIEWPEQ